MLYFRFTVFIFGFRDEVAVCFVVVLPTFPCLASALSMGFPFITGICEDTVVFTTRFSCFTLAEGAEEETTLPLFWVFTCLWAQRLPG